MFRTFLEGGITTAYVVQSETTARGQDSISLELDWKTVSTKLEFQGLKISWGYSGCAQNASNIADGIKACRAEETCAVSELADSTETQH